MRCVAGFLASHLPQQCPCAAAAAAGFVGFFSVLPPLRPQDPQEAKQILREQPGEAAETTGGTGTGQGRGQGGRPQRQRATRGGGVAHRVCCLSHCPQSPAPQPPEPVTVTWRHARLALSLARARTNSSAVPSHLSVSIAVVYSWPSQLVTWLTISASLTRDLSMTMELGATAGRLESSCPHTPQSRPSARNRNS